MNENIISANIARLRREHGLTQDALAGKLGVTYQAVSKWENGASCPDVMLLPEIANIFNISIDELFGRVAPVSISAPTTVDSFMKNIPCDVPWEDDGKLRVVLFQGNELMQAIGEETLSKIKEVPFVYNGPALNISSALNIYCNNCDIEGDVSAAGNVFCGDVGGDVSSNGSVECSDISGNVEAQGSVKCSDIVGNAAAGGNISCADINGNASAGGELDCGDVSGNVSAGGNITCADINGDASAGGDITANEINGDITCSNVNADEIYGDVHAQGSVRCDHLSGDVYCSDFSADHYDKRTTKRRSGNNHFTIEFDNMDMGPMKENIDNIARGAEDLAKKAVSASMNFVDQLGGLFTPSGAKNSADSDADNIDSIITDEIDSAIDEAIENEDYDGISTRINDKMSKINDKINRYFNDKYGK